MKMIAIECTAEELKANKKIIDTITDALSNIFGSLCEIDDETLSEMKQKIDESNDVMTGA